MTLRKKGFIAIVSFALVLVTAFYFTGCKYQSNEQQLRTIILQESNIDYQSIFEEFENAELLIDESTNSLKFSGTQKIDSALFEEIDLVSLAGELSQATVRYEFVYSADDNLFLLTVTAEDSVNGEIIDNLIGVPFIAEDKNIDICFNADGTPVFLSELQASGLINNCGWFSSLVKAVAVVAVAVAVIAVVVAVVVVAAPAVAAAGAAVSSAIAVGGGTAALTGVTATAAITAAAAAGSAAMAGTAFAIASTTALVATSIALSAFVVDKSLQIVDDVSFINPFKQVRKLAASIFSTVATLIMDRVYSFAYLSKEGLVIMDTVKMNYIEAYAVLVASGLINVSSTGALTQEINNFVMPASLITLVNTIKTKGVKAGYCGIYTISESNAAKLAYAAGGFFKDKAESETHDNRKGSGYYYHFHDFTHNIHVWYGYAF